MKTKRFLAMILSLAMVLSLLPASMASAAEFSGGDGAEGNPYKISTVEDLKQLASAVNTGTTYAGEYFELTENLDLSGENWTPIGNGSRVFQGTFNGGFHIIYNLTIDTSNRYCGLFGKLQDAEIQNLGIENANITSSYNDVAALAGNAQGGTIANCYVTGTVKGKGAVSGILGSTHSSSYTTKIRNCYARVAIVKNGTSTKDLAGISGWNEATSVEIENCYSACTGEMRPVAGWSDGSAVLNNQFVNTYFDKTLSPDFSSDSGRAVLGRTSDELKSQETFDGWDFASVWAIAPGVNGGYPYLQGFTPGLGGAPGSVTVTVTDENNQPVTDAEVSILPNGSSDDRQKVTLNHEGDGVYSGTVTTSDETYDIYVNGTKIEGAVITQSGTNAAEGNVQIQNSVPPEEAEAGPFIVTGGQIGTDYAYDSENRVLNILTSTALEITAKQNPVTDASIAVAAGVAAKFTLNELEINLNEYNGSALSIPDGASLELTVKGKNLLKSYAAGPGILVDNGAELIINGEDTETLEVYGAQMAYWSEGDGASGGLAAGFAGIGGQNSSGGAYEYTGEITINGGTINAHGFGYGAGIGGGNYGSGGIITINGGIITARSEGGEPDGWIDSITAKASGIGASQGQPGGVITINGGTVEAYGGYGCAGIGGGTADVTISGGDVTAYGGSEAAGIGGYNQNKGEIKITIGADAKVTAYGGASACGIGQGSNTAAPVTLYIEDGAEVLAFSKEDSNRPAITAAANSAALPANLINAYITNMTLPADVPIVVQADNETKYLTVPAGSAGVAFTTDTAGEFIAKTAPEAEASLGMTYQFIRTDESKATVTSGTAFTMEQVKAVKAADFTKEPTPNAQADYENNRLTGLVPNAVYRLEVPGFYLEATSDADGNITHPQFPQFYGAQLTIIKLGNGADTLNSDPQYLQTYKPAVSGIAVQTAPAKTAYTVGDTADWSGLAVTLTYKAGSQEYTRDIALADFEASGINVSLANGAALDTVGELDVTVSCGGTATTFSITVQDTPKVAQIGDTKYETLMDAFKAAQEITEWNGSEVTRENPVEIQLLDHVVLSNTLIIEDRYGRPQTYHVKLDGAGFTVSRAADFKDYMVHVAQSSTLILENVIFDGTLPDGIANEAILYMGSNGKSGMPVHHDTHGNYVVLGQGAVLQNNHSAQSGGAVNVGAGMLILDGGAIQNNASDKSGGGVYVDSGKNGTNDYANEFYPARFIMNSGVISGNKAVNNYCYGGGVYVQSISKAEYEQGSNLSGFIMTGGTIENNAAYDGGAIDMSNYDNVQILGGTIQNNRCEDNQGTARLTGTTGIACDFGAILRIGGNVKITDQIGISYYSTSSGGKHGKIIVENALEVNGNPLPLRINSSNANCPDGTVLVEKAEGYTGTLNLSDFTWKYNRDGNENTDRILVANADGTQLLAATLQNAVQRGTTDLSYEYGVKLGNLDLSVCELYDKATGETLNGSWSIVYSEGENADTVKAINEGQAPYEIKAVFTPENAVFKAKEIIFHLTITKMTPDYTIPSGLTAAYGQTLADVSLPAGFTWQALTSTSVGNVGANTFQVTFTPEDTELYKTVQDIHVTIAVSQAVPTIILNVENPQGAGKNHSIDLVAAVTGVEGGAVPDGTVEFFNGEIFLGTAELSDGKAVYTWNNVPAGTHNLRAVYSGSANYTTAEDMESYDLEKDAQPELVISGVPETVAYGDAPFSLAISGGEGTGMLTYAVTSGSSVRVDADGKVTVIGVGESTITVIKEADANYSETSAAVTITVNKADPAYAIPTGLTATYGDTLADILLAATGNGTWKWMDENASVGNAGAQEHTAMFTPNDTVHYNVVENIPVTITVGKAEPSYTVPTDLTAVYGQTLGEVSLPAGFTWQDAATNVGNAGEQHHKATFTPNDTQNYNVVSNIDVTVDVKPAAAAVTLNTDNAQGEGENRSVDLVAVVLGVTGGEVPTETVTFYNGETAISEAVTITEGKATFTWQNVPVGEHTLKAVYSGSNNYNAAEATTTYNVDKDNQTAIEIEEIPAKNFGDEPFELNITGGSGSGAITYTIIGESVTYDETTGKFTIVKAGESSITVTKAADENYNEITVTVTINVAQKMPTLTTVPTAGRVRLNNKLSASALSDGVVVGLDGTTALEGVWTWKNDREMTEMGNFKEIAIFTPTDTNYAPLEVTDIPVTVYRPSSGGSLVTRYTVTFDSQGGSKVSAKTVNRNTAITEPAEPIKEGYTFEGWFTDKACTTAYDFSTKITGNITLYAKWAEDERPTEPTEPTEPTNPTEPDKWKNPFTDVSENDWYYGDVEYAVKNGLFSGMTDTEFSPDGIITRAMMVTVLYRAEGEPEVTGAATFADVSDNAYYTKAVVWGQQNGIIKGYSNTEFAPDQNITREQIAAIMHRYAQYKGYDVSVGENTNILSYADYDSISEYAIPSVQYAVGSGLMKGKTDATINPQDNATRAETAAILHRFIEMNK